MIQVVVVVVVVEAVVAEAVVAEVVAAEESPTVEVEVLPAASSPYRVRYRSLGGRSSRSRARGVELRSVVRNVIEADITTFAIIGPACCAGGGAAPFCSSLRAQDN